MKPPSNTHLSKPKQRAQLWTKDDLAYAFECAAEFLEAEEWPEDDGGAQVAAYREAAERVRRMADRLYKRVDGQRAYRGDGGPVPSEQTDQNHSNE
jgi:ubiquinone biosynthesis protein UbiJ